MLTGLVVDISMTSTAPTSPSRSESRQLQDPFGEVETKTQNDSVVSNKDKGLLGQKPNDNKTIKELKPKSAVSSYISQRSIPPVQANKTRVDTRKRSVMKGCTDPIITTNRFDCLATCET
ncbi:hypothetical protein AtNW77_Chr4g0310521 [Arabidopsis thaliana]|uniref:Uncharacterized protein n=5 Tax=Arabidopsis TaxID=3701 RepID=Q5Q0B2_ARATH|nr:uncharacterized protein AT4G31960 [Arabidopsis thaliana]KAG7618087.1 hypothetical protein ISN45_At04g033890 [Arabidopsis thaliana x Arabidopsis arenosa]KAG7622550.1 hypothetical protein ISN44_As04g033330 [Arabidopsis suecica]AAV68875.1 hypothetical protein AT4G31960 [Arabidopsis thaliana]AAX23902.1 hypothetical protein At4g31960 [Arabidopsis thaliana]AEE85983.1 hypothetical protein AT4G31960 [Arabidopsis thaliana]|eukprot:NP_194924.2 hypothetical protein AT4G31960 [Arabidopsis thaliana]